MSSETLLATFLSFPIGIAVNLTSSTMQQFIDIIGRSNVNPLKNIFIKSFIKAVDEHNKHYDNVSSEIANKLKKGLKVNSDILVDIFLKFPPSLNILSEIDNPEYIETVAKEITKSYLSDIDCNQNSINKIVVDCFKYYKTSFYKYMNEKDGIIALLENSKTTNDSLTKIIEILNKNSAASFSNYFDTYKDVLLGKFREIDFFGLGLDKHKNKKKQELVSIYVKPRFKKITKDFSDNLSNILKEEFSTMNSYNEDSEILLEQIFDSLDTKNVVIIGDPGSGKSTLAKYIVTTILIQKEETFYNKSVFEYIPFRIELRKYIKFKRKHKCSIVNYIASILEHEYQIASNKVDFMKLFESEKTLVFFDGLDEIFDIADKIEVRDDISAFVSQYKSSRAVVTSRIIGYDDTKFNDKFVEFNILNFNDNQIEEYVKKWYQEKNSKTNDFYLNEFAITETKELLNEITTLEEELRRNPLLLSLIIILYQNNGQLPNSKLELYKSCTKTLVENWDQRKEELEINIDENLKLRKENIFSSLALWQYIESSNKSSKININNKTVQKQIASSIIELEITDDRIIAENLSSDFISYAEKRSLYFDNTFTHKTFWEYYTALRIFQKYYIGRDNAGLELIFTEYIDNAFWFNVIELLINMIDEEQCDNKEINNIIENYVLNKSTSYGLFLNIIPYVVHVSDKVIKRLIDKALYTCILDLKYNNAHLKETEIDSIYHPSPNSTTFINLVKIGRRRKFDKILNNCFDELYSQIVSNNLILKYYLFYYENFLLGGSKLSLSHIEDLEKVKIESPEIFSYYLFYDQSNNSHIDKLIASIIEFKKLFGRKMLTQKISLYYLDIDNIFPSPFHIYINNQFKTENLNSVIYNFQRLIKNGISIDKTIDNTIISYEWEVDNDVQKYYDLINSSPNWKITHAILKIVSSKNTIIDAKRYFSDDVYKNYINDRFKGNTNYSKIMLFIENFVKKYMIMEFDEAAYSQEL